MDECNKKLAKERIRGPNLEVFIPRREGVSALKTFQRVGEAGRVIASQKRMSKVLFEPDEWKSLSPAFASWTGTMTAYAEPYTSFSKSKMFSRNDGALVYVDPKTLERWLFLLSGVHAEYLDKSDAILVVEHPDYSVEAKGRDIVVKPNLNAVDIVFNFPASVGWYLGDPIHDIPAGELSSPENREARYLWRTAGVGRIGPGAIGDWRNVGLDYRLSGVLGVAVEAADTKDAV